MKQNQPSTLLVIFIVLLAIALAVSFFLLITKPSHAGTLAGTLAGTTGPGDRALVGMANDGDYNCSRNDDGQCAPPLQPLLPVTGAEITAVDREADRTMSGDYANTYTPARVNPETDLGLIVVFIAVIGGILAFLALSAIADSARRVERNGRGKQK